MAPSRYQITIDGIRTECDSEESILTVSRRLGIEIPTLCFLEGKKQLESCGVCMVEVDGHSSFIPACASKVTDGMTIHTDSIDLREARKTALELLFSDHLGDCLAPCERACPAQIDIPCFIREIKRGHPERALRLIQETIALTGVLGRVCPRFCERVCRRAEVDQPIPICSLKRYPADYDLGLENPFKLEPKPSTRKRVAIVGGGIVGLTAAYYLALEGHGCTIFESQHRLGGALDSIIPEFRLPKDVLSFEITRVLEMGVETQYGMELGRNLHLKNLQKEFDTVLVAIGATKETPPEIEGIEWTQSGLAFLKDVSSGKVERVEGSAVVVGNGPAAMDTARSLLRLGADRVSMVMTPSIDTSHFFKTWIPDGIAEGIHILDLCLDISVEREKSGGLLCRFLREGKKGRIEADQIYHASRVAPDIDFLQSLGLKTGLQGVKIDRRTQGTNLDKVFASGNIAMAGRYAVQGSAAGRQVAGSIHEFLSECQMNPRELIDNRLPQLSDEELKTLFAGATPILDKGSSKALTLSNPIDFSEVLPGLDNDVAREQADRCLQCDCSAKRACLLRIRGTEWEARTKAYVGERPQFERDATHPEVVYESGKCIKCGRCISVAQDHREELGLTYIGRGFKVRVGVPLGHDIREGLKVAAKECVEVCPTGALSFKR